MHLEGIGYRWIGKGGGEAKKSGARLMLVAVWSLALAAAPAHAQRQSAAGAMAGVPGVPTVLMEGTKVAFGPWRLPFECSVEEPRLGHEASAVRQVAFDFPRNAVTADSAVVIDILFFYTEGFKDDFVRLGESMEGNIHASMDSLNRALANSGVNATFRVAGIEQHPAMPARQSSAMRWINEDARAKERRNQVGADLVYALVDDRAGFLGVACQPGTIDASGGSGEECFWGSVNNFCGESGFPNCGEVWRTVLRHEVGHNLGIQHGPEFGGDPDRRLTVVGSAGRSTALRGAVGYCGGECWGHKDSTEPSYGTVMGGNNLEVFSSSSYRFAGRVVGEPGVHEAAKALSFTAEAVSRYRTAAPPTFPAGATISDQRWTEGAMIAPLVLPAATGGDGEVTYSLRPTLPRGVLFDDSSRVLSGRPMEVSGPVEYAYTATDAAGGSAFLSFTIEVVEQEGNCRSSGSATCLQDSRYEVTVDWWTADGQSGEAQVADVGTEDSGLFWFFSSTNWELLVKVLDACAVNDHHWVFGAATTDLGYRVTVTDTESGDVREYRNEAGRAAQAIADVTAFSEACAETGAAVFARVPDPLHPLDPSRSPESVESKHAADSILLLQNGRFDVRVQWATEAGETGPGSAVPERTVDSGMFWFFEPSNWEMLVKVLDGCAVNGNYWVLAGSATTLGFEITVTDTAAGSARQYTKSNRNERAAAFVDSAAFPCRR